MSNRICHNKLIAKKKKFFFKLNWHFSLLDSQNFMFFFKFFIIKNSFFFQTNTMKLRIFLLIFLIVLQNIYFVVTLLSNVRIGSSIKLVHKFLTKRNAMTNIGGTQCTDSCTSEMQKVIFLLH